MLSELSVETAASFLSSCFALLLLVILLGEGPLGIQESSPVPRSPVQFLSFVVMFWGFWLFCFVLFFHCSCILLIVLDMNEICVSVLGKEES